MDTASISEASRWALNHGYTLMFIAMLIEGPVVTAAGAFASALGYFNLWLVFLISILGNLIPDIIYYAIGFWGREKFIDKYGRYIGLTKEKIMSLEKFMESNAGKTMTFVKLMPLLATPGLIAAGISKMPLKKYTWLSLTIIIPSSLFFLIAGYYFGFAYKAISRLINYVGYLALIIVAFFSAIHYLQKKLRKKLAEKIERM